MLQTANPIFKQKLAKVSVKIYYFLYKLSQLLAFEDFYFLHPRH